MPEVTPVLSPNEPDPALIERLSTVKRISLGAVILVASLNLCAAWTPGLACAFAASRRLMGADAALASLLCALGLHLCDRETVRLRQLGTALAFVTILLAGWRVVGSLPHAAASAPPILASGCGVFGQRLTLESAAAFLLLAAAILPVKAGSRIVIRLAELAVFALCLLVLILISSYIFAAMRGFGLSSAVADSPLTLACLALLTHVAVLRRAEAGVFSIFLGRGAGSRLARTLIPVFLVLQFVREAGRTHLVRAHVLPAHYGTAILASAATMLSLILLLLLAWKINTMEVKVQELSLRDELTGLYNLRGFTLLAEQGLRLAQRTQMPFSVLYIDLDNLKLTNDTYGHQAGSSLLSETGHLMKATFRETDVMGRIGGDEFAVAGHFSHVAVSIAAERLKAACAARAADLSRPFPLRISVGYASAAEHAHESLRDLLAAADRAMYEDKRSKKQAGN